jgi:hypothetical protein
VRKGHEARLELLLGDKERAVRRYQIYASKKRSSFLSPRR